MGFGDALNWMNDKLKQSGCAAVGKINNGAQQLKGYCPDSQSTFNAAAYVGDVVITESLRGIPGGSILCWFAQDALRVFHGRMRSERGTNNAEELQNRIHELQEGVKLQTELIKLLRGRYN